MPRKPYRVLAQESPAFLQACEEAGTEPTKRQFSKFIQRRGRAWEAHRRDQQAERPAG